MNALDAILSRRSCRKFTDQPIETEKLHQLLEAAMSGPSCVNASVCRKPLCRTLSSPSAIRKSTSPLPARAAMRTTGCILISGKISFTQHDRLRF